MSVEARTQIQRVPVALPVVHSDLVRRQMRLAWWLLLPSLLVVALVALVPLAQTVYESFTNERLASNRAAQFVSDPDTCRKSVSGRKSFTGLTDVNLSVRRRQRPIEPRQPLAETRAIAIDQLKELVCMPLF